MYFSIMRGVRLMSLLRFMTAGESHGPALTAIIEGLPAGLKLDEDAINKEFLT